MSIWNPASLALLGNAPAALSPPVEGEPAVPATWAELFYDDFPGTALNRTKWQIVYSGNSSNNNLTWNESGIIVNNGLTLRAFKIGAAWQGGGIQQGNTVTGFAGYGNFQCTIKARFPAGQGVGAYIDGWPVTDVWPPEMSILETPGAAKQQAMVTWHWPPGNNQSTVLIPTDLTVDHLFTIRRTNNAWRYWIDGIEKQVPADWVTNPDATPLAIGMANFVAAAGDAWYGGGPDGTTPDPYDARITYVRVHGPGTAPPPGAITLTPSDPGDLITAPQAWTTQVSSPGRAQVQWIVLDSNFVGSGTTTFTTVNLVNGVASITCTFLKPGDFITVKSMDFATEGNSGPVVFGGVKTITLNPASPGDLGIAPRPWTTQVSAPTFTQIQWAIFNVSGAIVGAWTIVAVTNGAVSLTPTFTQAGQTLQVRSLDSVTQAASGPVSFSGATRTLGVSPQNPGDLGSPPKTWTVTATVTGMSQIKWAVFNSNFTVDAGAWNVVDVPSGSTVITCTFVRAAQMLIIKSMDEALEFVSGPVSFTTVVVPPITGGDDYLFAQAFKQDLAMGINLERSVGRYVTTAYGNELAANGVTWVRMFMPSKLSWGYASPDEVSNYLDSIQALLASNIKKIHFDFQDVLEPGDVENDQATPFVTRCADAFAARNFDPRRVCVGPTNEYAYMTNEYWRPYRETWINLMRQRMPNHVLVDNSADWGDPRTLTNGSFVPFSNKRMLYQWHIYTFESDIVGKNSYLKDMVDAWSAEKGVVTINGEYGANSDIAEDYNSHPRTIYAISRDAGSERPNMWTITYGSGLRLNVSGNDYTMRPDVINAYREATNYIKSQPYYSEITEPPPPPPPPPSTGVMGPLVVAGTTAPNNRWLKRPDGVAPLFTGSHNWENFQDSNANDPPIPFNWNVYRAWFRERGGNLMRMWRTESSKRGPYWTGQMPWNRTGPGNANDGKLKFNLNSFNDAYFNRLAQRVADCESDGIYVSIMLFNAWSTEHANVNDTFDPQDAWTHVPLHPNNNINGIDGTGGRPAADKLSYSHTRLNAGVLAVQEAYVRRVIDAVNGYTNVLYETCNEPRADADTTAFLNGIVNLVKSHQANKPRQHPVIHSSPAPWLVNGDNTIVANSPADVVSPVVNRDNPAVNTFGQPSIVDTDHDFGVGGSANWCWKVFTRGHHLWNMDGLLDVPNMTGLRPFTEPSLNSQVASVRTGMLQIRVAVERLGSDLTGYAPAGGDASTGYCIRKVNSGYIAYAENGGSFTVNLTASASTNFFPVWINVDNEASWTLQEGGIIGGGANTTFNSPFGGFKSALILVGTSVAPPPPPTPGEVANIDILHRGQSNAYFAHDYGSPYMLEETLESLTGIAINMISHRQDYPSTIHSGTAIYYTNPGEQWLVAPNGYGGNVEDWGEESPMSECNLRVQQSVSSDPNRPFVDFSVHWEYDLGMDDANGKGRYRDAYREAGRRIANMRPKNPGRLIRLIGYCPYEGGSWANISNIHNAWRDDCADPNRHTYMACGNMLDGEPNTQYTDPPGDFSHWGNQAGPRIYPRVAFRLAKLFWDLGWCNSSANLGDCPSMGPWIQSASRNGNSVNLTIVHDKGTSLVGGQDGIDWRAFSYGNSNSGADAAGGQITGNNTIRIDFNNLPSNGTEKLYHCESAKFHRKQLIRDNWHSNRPGRYAGVSHINLIEFPLQKTNGGVQF